MSNLELENKLRAKEAQNGVLQDAIDKFKNENALLRQELEEATSEQNYLKNMVKEQEQKLTAIEDEIKNNQYNSVQNLVNKIKTILFEFPGKKANNIVNKI